MSFRIEEKLLINNLQILEFKNLLFKKKTKKLFPPRIIKSLYFENSKGDMYKDSIEGTLPRKKIRVRNYPENNNTSLYFETKISSVEGRFKNSEIIPMINISYYRAIIIPMNLSKYFFIIPIFNFRCFFTIFIPLHI